MIQYSCVDKYIDVIVADSALPFWRSDIEFDCILADRNYERHLYLKPGDGSNKIFVIYSSLRY